MAQHLEQAIQTERQNNQGFLWLLDHLVNLETEQRWQQATQSRFKSSRLRDRFLSADFDFNFSPSRKKNRSLILQLLTCDFVEHKKDVIFIGTTGAGKTRLAKTIAYQACLKNQRVLFTTAIDMVNHLIAAKGLS